LARQVDTVEFAEAAVDAWFEKAQGGSFSSLDFLLRPEEDRHCFFFLFVLSTH
jgi:hypothetical protein